MHQLCLFLSSILQQSLASKPRRNISQVPQICCSTKRQSRPQFRIGTSQFQKIIHHPIQITKISCFSKMVNRTIYQNMRSENSCCRKTLMTITIWMTFQRHDLSIAIHFRLNSSHASLTKNHPLPSIFTLPHFDFPC